MSYLEIKSLSAFYGKAQALSDISLSVEEGEIIAIVGANGAGKSTLLDSIMGLVRQTGQIDFDGSVISENPPLILSKRDRLCAGTF